MRTMAINKRKFTYLPFSGLIPVLGEDSYETGEMRATYGTAVEVYGNISAAKGNSQVEQFGNLPEYDKVIVLGDPNFPMDENCVLFVDKQPEYDTDGTPLYDYIVKKVARSLNNVAYAITRVTNSGPAPTPPTPSNNSESPLGPAVDDGEEVITNDGNGDG